MIQFFSSLSDFFNKHLKGRGQERPLGFLATFERF